MKLSKTRVLCGILSLLAVSSAMLSCGDSSVADPGTTQAVASDAVTDEVTDAETEFPMPELPEKDYGGRDFTFLTSSDSDDNGSDWVTTDIYVETTTGDVVTDAVYERNMWLEETFNIKIKEYQCVTMTETKKAVTAGITDYDATITSIANGCTLGSGNYVLDLKTVPYIDLTQSWWDQGIVEGVAIDGRVYFATGDITIVDNDATWVLMFNKQLAQDLDYDFYQMVNDNKWDMDTFYKCALSAAKDLNGDGKMYGPDDQYGFATSDVSSYGLMYGSGVTFTKTGDDGYPMLDTDADLLTAVVDKAGEIMSDTNTTVITTKQGITDSDELRYVFEGGRSLFFGEVMQCVTRMRESTTDFGLIPFPKYDVTQESYHHIVHRTAGKGVCIPSTQPDPEMAGIIIEAMAAKSVSTVTNAYYDKALTYKYMRDEESAKMLDIILSTRVFDLCYIYDWGSLASGMASQITNGKGNATSTYDKKLKAANKALTKTVDAYRENE